MNETDRVRLRSDEFPLAADWAYLNHAGSGPVPLTHVRAAETCLRAMAQEAPRTSLADTEAALARVRSLSARLLHCMPEDIAVLSSTVQAVNLVPLALDWAPGDEVITLAGEYPSVLMALDRLRAFGVIVRRIPLHDGRLRLADLEASLSHRTRMVALSLVSFATGWRAPIADIAAICAPRGVWLVVDAIQAVGAVDIDAPATGADVLAAQGYKHLLSGYGVAPCYCSSRTKKLLPAIGSRLGVRDHLDATRMIDAEAAWSETARRFESAIPSLTGMAGMAASLDLLLAADPVETEAHVFILLDYAAEALGDFGWGIVSPIDRPGERSSLLTLKPPANVDGADVVRHLLERRVSVSLREGNLRLSPHLYSTPGDIERLVEGCRAFA